MTERYIHIDHFLKLWSTFGDESRDDWKLLYALFTEMANDHQLNMYHINEVVTSRLSVSCPQNSSSVYGYFEQVFYTPPFQEALGHYIIDDEGEKKADSDRMAFRTKYALKENNLEKLRPLWKNEMPADKLSKLLS